MEEDYNYEMNNQPFKNQNYLTFVNNLYNSNGRDKQAWKDLLISIYNSYSYNDLLSYLTQRIKNEPWNILTLDILDYLIDYGPVNLIRDISRNEFMNTFFYLLKKKSGSGIEVQKKGIYLTKKWYEKGNEYPKEYFEGFSQNYITLNNMGITLPPAWFKLPTYNQYISPYEVNLVKLEIEKNTENQPHNEFNDINNNKKKLFFSHMRSKTLNIQEPKFKYEDDIPENDNNQSIANSFMVNKPHPNNNNFKNDDNIINENNNNNNNIINDNNNDNIINDNNNIINDNNNIINENEDDLYCAPLTPLGNINKMPKNYLNNNNNNNNQDTIYNNGFKSYFLSHYGNNNNNPNRPNNNNNNQNNNIQNNESQNMNNNQNMNQNNRNQFPMYIDPYPYKHAWISKINSYNQWINQGYLGPNRAKLRDGIKEALAEIDRINGILNSNGNLNPEEQDILVKIKYDLVQTCSRYEKLVNNQPVEEFHSGFEGNTKYYIYNKENFDFNYNLSKEGNKYVQGLYKLGDMMKNGLFTVGKAVKYGTIRGYNYVKEKVQGLEDKINNNETPK